jgi:4'-phosphopantetheinyl transferase
LVTHLAGLDTITPFNFRNIIKSENNCTRKTELRSRARQAPNAAHMVSLAPAEHSYLTDQLQTTMRGAAIDIWLAFYDTIIDPGLLAAFEDVLSADERRQHVRFHFPDDRKRYLVTRFMVRTILSHYAAVSPKEWTFSASRHGRPEIAGPPGAAPGLVFNISHSNGLIALAVSYRRALGIDVESLAARPASFGIAEKFFAPFEVESLRVIPEEQRHQRFFEYWTFKEAYVKARGMGLSLPLDRFGFHFPGAGHVGLDIDPGLADTPERWALWQYRPAAAYLLAICAERLPGPAPAVNVRQLIPGAGYKPLALSPDRTSVRVQDPLFSTIDRKR